MSVLEVKMKQRESNNETYFIKISKPSHKTGVVQCLLGLLMHSNYCTGKMKAFLSGLGTNVYKARKDSFAFGSNSLLFLKVKHGWDKGTSVLPPKALLLWHPCMETVNIFSLFGICIFLLCAMEKKSLSIKQLRELTGDGSGTSEILYWFEAWKIRRIKKYGFVPFNYLF